ncbi:hypothetical protein M9458_026594, partial [Cirrhinus mrigala]
PLTFSYEMRQRDPQTGALKQEEADSSCGLLSVTRQGMKLRLLPPEPGTYEVKLFARREGELGVLRWICSLELECPSIQKRHALPDNPYLNWGLAAGASALGIKGCSVAGEEAVEVGDGGECKVILQTSRPLMMVCELAHRELDVAAAKRCLAPQITPEELVCNVMCLYKGFYRLSIFVQDYDSGSGTFQNAGNYLLHCQSPGLNPNVLYPPDLGLWCGPGVRTQEAGLSHFSHTGAIVNAPQGRCNITFHCASPDLQIHTTLSAELHEQTHFPLAGVYRLGIYGRKPPQQDYMSLPEIRFHVCIQRGEEGVCAGSSEFSEFPVCVVGEKRTDLKMNKSRVWEGEAVTGNATQLKLAAVTKESNDMHVLMTFDVLNLKNEL